MTPTKKSSSCTKCNAGKYQNQRGQAICLPCEIGKFSKETENADCITCGGGNDPPENNEQLAYQDLTGQISCKLCDANNNEVASSSKTGCNTCSSTHGPNSFLTSANTCDYW